eukprot:TRINITY_DN204_c0_g2_i1.p1 TRINITY_DN204_c0_g2~~TRINITY_DN204_c0_g2_i1.p1  ORF type:complete len:211 (-),score=23.98 TRINITY_DN204_c0_g2_i1:124-756(-)
MDAESAEHREAAKRRKPGLFGQLQYDVGCKVEGWLEVPRVPGNFHIEARSATHDMVPSMANLSHTVNHLQFGDALAPMYEARLPEKLLYLMKPLDKQSFILDKIHQAPQHYIKIVSTLYDYGPRANIPAYQITSQNRIATYGKDEIPEAKFSYDTMPIAVIVSQREKPFYSFVTSLLAIIGGTYTVVSIFDGFVFTLNENVIKGYFGKQE